MLGLELLIVEAYQLAIDEKTKLAKSETNDLHPLGLVNDDLFGLLFHCGCSVRVCNSYTRSIAQAVCNVNTYITHIPIDFTHKCCYTYRDSSSKYTKERGNGRKERPLPACHS